MLRTRGLCSGTGRPQAGLMCVCLAMGRPLCLISRKGMLGEQS